MPGGLKTTVLLIAAALDREELDDNEWFDPVILERLTDGAHRVRIEGAVKVVFDLPAR
jgi:hypothetical protein